MRTHGLTKTSTYRVWTAMIQRCQNPKCRSYARYGARGITVTPEWMTFQNFIRDMGMNPPGCTLDRIDNNAGYEKSNCRWSSPEIQSQNRRGVRLNHDAVREIRRRVASGERARVVARSFAVSEQTIHYVVKRHTWKNVA